MQAANSLASWSVRADSPFKTFEDVVKAAKAKPGSISISTSGTGGLWHELALLVSDAAGIKLKFVPYKGGKKATLAGLQGETDIAGGGVHEHVSLIRSGKLRNLQQTGKKDLNVDGINLKSIGNILPSTKPFLPFGGCYNLIMHRSTPPEVIKLVTQAYKKAVSSEKFMSIAKKKFFDIDVKFGEAADKRAAQLETMTVHTFNKYADQIGKKVKSHKELGLPTPENFENWWPPKGYKPIKI
jgi:tripartite-type tricarboxylate transporter receptor subunit TctC